jgi:ribosomal protein S18 acetylase RimI-like enzyme
MSHHGYMAPVIRLARIEDHHSVAAVVEAAYVHYVPRIGREPGPMLDDYAALIGTRRVYVLDNDGAIDGIVVLIPEAGSMFLDNVAVSPKAQGRGFGRMLLKFAEQSALDAGYRSIKLYTNEAMTENIALYSRIGYVETHRVEEKGLRRIYMTKSLR